MRTETSSMNGALHPLIESSRALADWVYPAAVVAVYVFVFVDRRRARARSGTTTVSMEDPLGPVELGLLHSKRNALLAALGELRADGLLEWNGVPRSASGAASGVVHPISSTVYAAIYANRSRTDWRMLGCADRELDKTADDLRRRGLLADPVPRRLRLSLTVPVAILGVLQCIYTMTLGSVGIGFAVTIVTTVAAALSVVFALSAPRRTKAGDETLAEERRRNAGLHPRNFPALSTYGTGVLAISAGLFGPLALRQLAPGVAAAPYVGVIAAGGINADDDGTDPAASCGGCGTGGGGGGDGGGCGGGGCGGGGCGGG